MPKELSLNCYRRGFTIIAIIVIDILESRSENHIILLLCIMVDNANQRELVYEDFECVLFVKYMDRDASNLAQEAMFSICNRRSYCAE